MATEKSISHVNNWPNAAGFGDLKDTTTPISLVLTGKIPSYVNGSLFRTGPGSYTVPLTNKPGQSFKVYHWFDGFSQYHKFDISPPSSEYPDGKVMYRSTSGSEALKKEIDDHNGSPVSSSFAYRDPCKTKFAKFFTKYDQNCDTTAANVSVTINPRFPSPMSGDSELVAKTDANMLLRLNYETLEPEERFTWTSLSTDDIEKALLSGPISAAHSCFDDGVEFNYVLNFGKNMAYTIFSLDRNRKLKVEAVIPVSRSAYIHSFFLTKKYIVVCLWQANFKYNGLAFMWNRNVLDSMDRKWNPNAKTEWFVIPRDGSARHDSSKIKVFKSDPFFSFHSINAYDDGDDIVLDLAQFKDHGILWDLTVEALRSDTATGVLDPSKLGSYTRWRLPGVSTTKQDGVAVVEAQASQSMNNIELPTFNPSKSLAKHKYVYGINSDGKSSFFDRLLKIDVDTLEAKFWTENGCTPSEPLFVADPNGKDEDDGVLLTVVLDGFQNRSMLVILDAKTMKEVCRATMPKDKIVGLGFHGSVLLK
ncbi:carotenoid oxygenase [Lipomyces tetrasporus]|uniref:Carotenoid oxygenase n=1 Tax=Lipomyces tetrasporus TaxID=54092 RepID=A0AAD7VQ98_9ASCO|nr:carotenoid oxygenase [Lipomyces tetrasporus]KAJ8096925.1 carotenoid oxygenase [Lipomyces tetrasporus]